MMMIRLSRILVASFFFFLIVGPGAFCQPRMETNKDDTVPSAVVTLTEANFNEFMQANNGMAFVDLDAPWCVWCQRLAPTWEKFAQQIKADKIPIGVGKVDCMAQSELCRKEKIMAFPTLRWYQNGEAISPDYKMDRTVDALMDYVKQKISSAMGVVATSFPQGKEWSVGPSTTIVVAGGHGEPGGNKDNRETSPEADLPQDEYDDDLFGGMYLDDDWFDNQNGLGVEEEAVVTLDENRLNDALQEYPYVLVDYSTDWCSHCRLFAPTWQRLGELLIDAKWQRGLDRVVAATNNVVTWKEATKVKKAAEYADAEGFDRNVMENITYTEQEYQKALKAVQSSPIMVAKVDCVNHHQLCRKQNIMSYPTLRLYVDGENNKDFWGSRTIINLLQFLVSEQEKAAQKEVIERAEMEQKLHSKETAETNKEVAVKATETARAYQKWEEIRTQCEKAKAKGEDKAEIKRLEKEKLKAKIAWKQAIGAEREVAMAAEVEAGLRAILKAQEEAELRYEVAKARAEAAKARALLALRDSAQGSMAEGSQELDTELEGHRGEISTMLRLITEKYFPDETTLKVEELVHDRLTDNILTSLQEQVELFIAQGSEDVDQMVAEKEAEGLDVMEITGILDNYEEGKIDEVTEEIFKIVKGLKESLPYVIPNTTQETIEKVFEQLGHTTVELEFNQYQQLIMKPPQVEASFSEEEVTAALGQVLIKGEDTKEEDEAVATAAIVAKGEAKARAKAKVVEVLEKEDEINLEEEDNKDLPQDGFGGNLQKVAVTLRPENLAIVQKPKQVPLEFLDVSRGHIENPHLGARDEDGSFGYVHDETALRMNPPPFLDNYAADDLKADCAKRDNNYIMLHEKIRVNLDAHKAAEESGKKHDKIFCFVYTTESSHSKIPAIRETWGSKCDGFMVGSTKTDKSLGTVEIPHEGPEEYNNRWQKVRSMWSYVYDNYYEKYDWFHIGDDDLFLIVENLRLYLESDEIKMAANGGVHFPTGDESKQTPLYLGRRYAYQGDINDIFNAGGSGYTLNKAALKLLVTEALPNYFPHAHTFSEETMVAKLLRKFDVFPYDTKDEAGGERYMPFMPGHHYGYQLPADPINSKDWYAKYSINIKEGVDHCATESVAFHYVKGNDMYRLFALIYGAGDKLKGQHGCTKPLKIMAGDDVLVGAGASGAEDQGNGYYKAGSTASKLRKKESQAEGGAESPSDPSTSPAGLPPHEQESQPSAVQLTEENFDEFMQTNNGMAVVDLYMPWCVWSQRLAPTWERFAQEVKKENLPIGVGKVDCMKQANLCRKEKIMAFPTLRWYQNHQAITPDYKMDRTVDALMDFVKQKMMTNTKAEGFGAEVLKPGPHDFTNTRLASATASAAAKKAGEWEDDYSGNPAVVLLGWKEDDYVEAAGLEDYVMVLSMIVGIIISFLVCSPMKTGNRNQSYGKENDEAEDDVDGQRDADEEEAEVFGYRCLDVDVDGAVDGKHDEVKAQAFAYHRLDVDIDGSVDRKLEDDEGEDQGEDADENEDEASGYKILVV